MRRFARLALVVLVATACGGPPPKKAREPRAAEDPWDAAPHSGEWLYVTRDVTGGHAAECKAVAEWIAGEDGCEATVCTHARSLAKDWVSRCAKLDADDVQAVRDTLRKVEARAKSDEEPCATEADEILKGSCEGDPSCKTSAQAWATRCGAKVSSPLLLRMIERSVERRGGKRTSLDARGCDELLVEVKKGYACAQQFACEDAAKAVTTYRARCVSDDEPDTLAAAIVELAVLRGAQTGPSKLAVAKGKISARDVATALEDGAGAALSVCDERVVDLASYVKKRIACKGGSVTFARAFKSEQGLEVRLGTLPFADDATFAARFPSLAVHGEAELRDALALAAFEAALDAATKSPPTEAAIALARAVAQHAAAIKRAAAFREALAARDAALAPALREIGKAKAKSAKARLTVAELSGLLARADSRAFADVGPDGVVSVGASSRASELETSDILPRAMSAYRDAVKPALALGKLRRVDAKTIAMAKQYGRMKAQACGEAENKLSDTEAQAIACAFAVTPCDETKLAALGAALDETRTAAEEARHQLDLVMTGPAAGGRNELVQAAATAGCLEPWW